MDARPRPGSDEFDLLGVLDLGADECPLTELIWAVELGGSDLEARSSWCEQPCTRTPAPGGLDSTAWHQIHRS